MKKTYFAHPVNIYDEPIEATFEKLIACCLFGGDNSFIENPNQPHHQVGYNKYAARQKESDTQHKGMGYFFDEVLPNCWGGCIALPFLDGKFGLGVAAEAGWYIQRGLPVWSIRPSCADKIPSAEELRDFIANPLNGLFNIGPIDSEDKNLLTNIDKDNGSRLVLSHQETRLRTWRVYGQEKRPYEGAHLVNLPIPEGFYPKG